MIVLNGRLLDEVQCHVGTRSHQEGLIKTRRLDGDNPCTYMRAGEGVHRALHNVHRPRVQGGAEPDSAR